MSTCPQGSIGSGTLRAVLCACCVQTTLAGRRFPRGDRQRLALRGSGSAECCCLAIQRPQHASLPKWRVCCQLCDPKANGRRSWQTHPCLSHLVVQKSRLGSVSAAPPPPTTNLHQATRPCPVPKTSLHNPSPPQSTCDTAIGGQSVHHPCACSAPANPPPCPSPHFATCWSIFYPSTHPFEALNIL